MVQKLDVEYFSSIRNLFGDSQIFLAGFQITGRMIMRNGNCRRQMFQGSLEQNTHINDRLINSSRR